MKIRLAFILLFINSIACAQSGTFSMWYDGIHTANVIELPDTTYFFEVRTNYFFESNGIRGFHISKNGVIIDSMGFSAVAPYLGRTGHSVLLEDTTVVSFMMENDAVNDRRFYLTHWQMYPNLDTKKLVQIYPDSGNTRWQTFTACEIKLAKDGNILISGFLFDQTPWSLVGYIAKYNQNMELIWETYIETDQRFRSIESIIEAPDGSFVVGGQSMRLGGTGNINPWMAKVDSTGNILWEHLFANFVPSSQDYHVLDGLCVVTESADGNITMVYSRNLDCGPNGEHCRSSRFLGDIRFMKLDWNGNILIDKGIGPNSILWSLVLSLQPVPGGGYVIGGTRQFPHIHGIVFRVTEEGDSIWWREPYIEQGQRDFDWSPIRVVKPTIDGGFIGGGMAFLWSFIPQTDSTHPQKAFVFRLDSNGCYGPGHCHDHFLTVEESPAPEAGVKVYPNPAVNEVNVEYTNAVPGHYHLIIRDMQGREVGREFMRPTAPQTQHVLMPIHQLPSGQYLLEIHGEKGREQVVKVKIN